MDVQSVFAGNVLNIGQAQVKDGTRTNIAFGTVQSGRILTAPHSLETNLQCCDARAGRQQPHGGTYR